MASVALKKPKGLGGGGRNAPFNLMEQLAVTSADFAMLAYSLIFLGGVISGWAFILGMQHRF